MQYGNGGDPATNTVGLAGHPALEFLNTTLRATPIELIGDGSAFLAWIVAAGLRTEAEATLLRRRLGAAALDETAARARALRTWAIAWLTRWRAAPDARHGPELRRLNELLACSSDYRQVVQRDGRLEIVEHHRDAEADELLGTLAVQLADLITREQAALVKRCDGADCTLWFVDRTKSHRRRFCSVAACGNRDKVAAFRARRRNAGKRR